MLERRNAVPIERMLRLRGVLQDDPASDTDAVQVRDARHLHTPVAATLTQHLAHLAVDQGLEPTVRRRIRR